jgi:hypothetical protein
VRALTGHISPQMEKEYSRRADQKRNAKAAVVAEQKAKLTNPENPSYKPAEKSWRALGESNPSCKIENLES